MLEFDGVVAANGTATVTNALSVTQNFNFYIVNSGVLQFIDVDSPSLPRVAGTAFHQTQIGTALTASAFLVNGTFVAGGQFGAVGRFDVSGSSISGVFDSFGGTPHSNFNTFGSYSINPDGSGQISILDPGAAFTFWMFSPTQAVALTQGTIPVNQSVVATGFIFAQQGPFTAAQFKGNYAVSIARATGGVASTGQVTSDGVGSFVGTDDLFQNGINPDVPITATWTFGTNGRGLASLSTTSSIFVNDVVFCPVSPSEIIFADQGGAIGFAEKQCSDCH